MSGHYGGNPYVWEGGANAPHISRYFLARGWVLPGETVVDAGCGTGYGTYLLSLVAKNATGIEIDEGCVAEANSRWKRANNKFICADLDKTELPDADVIVTIESSEHVCNFDRFLKQLQKHAKRLIIVTVPVGGTTWAYKDEPPTPATEKTDFNNEAHVEYLFATNGWKLQTGFRYGYSFFGIFFKKEPKEKK